MTSVHMCQYWSVDSIEIPRRIYSASVLNTKAISLGKHRFFSICWRYNIQFHVRKREQQNALENKQQPGVVSTKHYTAEECPSKTQQLACKALQFQLFCTSLHHCRVEGSEPATTLVRSRYADTTVSLEVERIVGWLAGIACTDWHAVQSGYG